MPDAATTEPDDGVPVDPDARPFALFDLDGTLTDPTAGIMTCHRWALDELGVAFPDDISDDEIVGLTADAAHEALGVPADLIEQTTGKYRERFAIAGWLEDTAYPGVDDLLEQLRDAGWMVGVAASKLELIATRLVERAELGHLDVVVGSSPKQKRTAKRDIVNHAIRTLGKPTAGVAVIGDRRQDIDAAKSLGMTAIGAAWGFGAIDELIAANADAVALTPDDAREALLG